MWGVGHGAANGDSCRGLFWVGSPRVCVECGSCNVTTLVGSQEGYVPSV